MVHTDASLPAGCERANLAVLAAYRSAVHADPAVLAWWGAQLAGGPVHPRAALVRTSGEQPHGLLLNGLYHLLWHGVVAMDWRLPLVDRGDLHPMARVWLAAGEVAR